MEHSEREWADKGAAGLGAAPGRDGHEWGSRSLWAQGTGGTGRLRPAVQGCGWTPGVCGQQVLSDPLL